MGRPLNKSKFGNSIADGPQLIVKADIGAGEESCWIVDQPGSRTYTVSSVSGGLTPDRTGRARLQNEDITAPGQATLGVLPFGGPVGTTATATFTFTTGSSAILGAPFVPPTISVPGAGYFIGDTVTPLGGVFSLGAVYTVLLTTAGAGPGGIVLIAITVPGVYTVPAPTDGAAPGTTTPLSTLTGPGGGAEIFISWDTLAVAVTGGGSDYSTPPAVSGSPLLFAGTYAASLTAGAVTSIAVSTPGFFLAGPTVAPIIPVPVIASPGVIPVRVRTLQQHTLKTFDGDTFKWKLGVAAPTDGVEADVPFG